MPTQIVSKIVQNQNVGILEDQNSGDPTVTFARYNLIYGFNGSGKSTITRMFASAASGAVNENLPAEASFVLEMSDGQQISSHQLNGAAFDKLLVFNSDFVDENFRWSEAEANPVFYIGKQQAELVDQLERKRQEHSAASEKERNFEELKKSAEKELRVFLRERAKPVAEILNLKGRKYEAPHFKKDLENGRSEATDISDEKMEQLRRICRTDQPLPAIGKIDVPLARIGEYLSDAVHLLHERPVNISIKRLIDHPEMVEWVRDGFAYHEQNALSECLYCGQQIDDSRRASLNDFLSKGITDFFDRLQDLVDAGGRLRFELYQGISNIPGTERFSPNLQTEAKTKRQELEGSLRALMKTLEGIDESLSSKRRTLDEVPVEDASAQLRENEKLMEAAASSASDFNKVIEIHDHNIAHFEDQKRAAEIEVRRHYSDRAYPDFKELTDTLGEAEEGLSTTQESKLELEQDIQNLVNKVREHGPAAELINGLIASYLGHNELQVSATDEGFQITRSGKPIHGLPSEGEKTAIAICYFISLLGAEGRKLDELIVVIDDPISSLDSRALNYAAALLRSCTRSAAQTFILTHNQQCLNEFRKHWKSKCEPQKGNPPEATFLYVDTKQKAGDSKRRSKLVAMPALLRTYDSEYHFLAEKVFRFDESDAGSFEHAYMMPNVLRRVLEVFLAFKDPGSHNILQKLQNLQRDHPSLDMNKLVALERLAQVESHSDNLEALVSLSSMTVEESKRATDALLEMMEVVDQKHLQALRRICRVRN